MEPHTYHSMPASFSDNSTPYVLPIYYIIAPSHHPWSILFLSLPQQIKVI